MSKNMPGEAISDKHQTLVDVTECPTCGRDDFDTERAMKSHHSQVHGESIKGRVVCCDVCDDTFRKQKKKIQQHDNHYCCDDCRVEGRKSRVTVSCNECDTDIEVIQSYAEKYDSIHCSESCRKNTFTVECDFCGKTVQKNGYQKERSKNYFCSNECHGMYKKENGIGRGKDNGMWSGGGVNYYGQNWHEKRNEALERDNYECVVCGLDEERHQEKYGNGLHVHHIEPLRTFDDKCNGNSLDNLITMCSHCHKKWEGLMLRPQ